MGDKLHSCFTPLVKKSRSVRPRKRLIQTQSLKYMLKIRKTTLPLDALELDVQQLLTNRVVDFSQVTE